MSLSQNQSTNQSTTSLELASRQTHSLLLLMLPKYRTCGGKRVPIRGTFYLDLIRENHIGRYGTDPNNLTKIKVRTRFQIRSQTRPRSFFSRITSPSPLESLPNATTSKTSAQAVRGQTPPTPHIAQS